MTSRGGYCGVGQLTTGTQRTQRGHTGRWAGGNRSDGEGGLLARRYERAARGTGQKAIFGYVERASLAFWDAYLKGDARAKEFLKSGALARPSDGAAKLSRK